MKLIQFTCEAQFGKDNKCAVNPKRVNYINAIGEDRTHVNAGDATLCIKEPFDKVLEKLMPTSDDFKLASLTEVAPANVYGKDDDIFPAVKLGFRWVEKGTHEIKNVVLLLRVDQAQELLEQIPDSVIAAEEKINDAKAH